MKITDEELAEWEETQKNPPFTRLLAEYKEERDCHQITIGTLEAANDEIDRLEAIIKKLTECLRPLGQNAEWSTQAEGRACGVSCDLGWSGLAEKGQHDPDCFLEAARRCLEETGKSQV